MLGQQHKERRKHVQEEIASLLGPGLVHLSQPLGTNHYLATVDVSALDKDLKDTNTISIVYVEKSLVYEGFDADFGPLNLACLYKFSNRVKKLLDRKKVVVHLTSNDARMRVNAAFLSGSFAVSIPLFAIKLSIKP